MKWPAICLGLSLFVVGCWPADSAAQTTQQVPSPQTTVPPASGETLFPHLAGEPTATEVEGRLHLPDSFRQRVKDRAYLDQMGALLHRVEARVLPSPQLYQRQTRFEADSIRLLRHQPAQLEQWRALPADFRPLRGFRAPIFQEGTNFWPALLDEKVATAEDRQVAEIVADGLAEEGLMSTFGRAIYALGVERCGQDPERAVQTLKRIGFPVDLVQYFSRQNEATTPSAVVKEVAAQISQGRRLESVVCELGTVPFRYTRNSPEFFAADESGSTQLGLLRMQMGGGYRDGVVPGGALDVMTQLASLVPEADYLISVPSEVSADFRRMVRDFWPLTRSGQATIVVEPLPLAAWAQDNGKAGYFKGGVPSTLVPRYATQDEVSFRFLPGESLLAEGLASAGHKVLQSPFLFQGGNMLVVEDPMRGDRVLLIGEAELYRNQALGLTVEQVLAAFRSEFGVQRCVPMPAASFHIDYDLCVRQHRGRVVVFVNDSLSAARLIISRGITALEQNGFMTVTDGSQLRDDLMANRWRTVYEAVAGKVFSKQNNQGEYPPPLLKAFAVAAVDSSEANFRCFLTALDLVASRAWTEETCPGPPAYRKYVGALRRLQAGAEAQRRTLEDLGWSVVSVPSMPDLEASVNYLNGIHDRQRYLIPIYGGFYQPLDQVAVEVFRGVLGSTVPIVPVRSAGAQRRHGALHCIIASYPAPGPVAPKAAKR
jgi:hypothetical protein